MYETKSYDDQPAESLPSLNVAPVVGVAPETRSRRDRLGALVASLDDPEMLPELPQQKQSLLIQTEVIRSRIGVLQQLEEAGARRHADQAAQVLAHESAITETRDELRRLAGAREGLASRIADAAAAAGLITAQGCTTEALLHAVEEAAPSLEELAARENVAPPPQDTALGVVESAVFGLAAPVVLGALLGITFGTVCGLISNTDVIRPTTERLPQLLFALAVGMIVLFLNGSVVYRAVDAVASAMEPENGWVVRLGGERAAAVVWAVVAGLLVSGELAVEATGLHDLHVQQLLTLARHGNVLEAKLLPWPAYLLLALVCTAPYLAFKAARQWQQRVTAPRTAWLEGLRRDAIQTRLADLRDVFSLAGRFDDLLDATEDARRELADRERARRSVRLPQGFDLITARRIQREAAAIDGGLDDIVRRIQRLVNEAEPGKRWYIQGRARHEVRTGQSDR